MGKPTSRLLVPILLSTIFAFVCPLIGRSQEVATQGVNRLAEIKGLYEAAEYDRALAALDHRDAAPLSAAEMRDVSVYQALCLLALGKTDEAAVKIEWIIRAEPLFRPSADLPNRLRALVDETRNRLRPELAQSRYKTGRQLFEADKPDAAVQEFELVIQLTDVPAGSAGADLGDLRLLATGFRDLAASAIARSKPPMTPVPDLPLQRSAEPEAIPPVTVRQNMPPWPAPLAASRRREQGLAPLNGVLEIVITPEGTVGSAKLIKRIDPLYDAVLLRAARDWKYQPAKRNGVPIQFVKTIAIDIR